VVPPPPPPLYIASNRFPSRDLPRAGGQQILWISSMSSLMTVVERGVAEIDERVVELFVRGAFVMWHT